MRKMNLSDFGAPISKRERTRIIRTSMSAVERSDEEMTLLMRSARDRFKKAMADGKISIVNKREWKLR